MRYMLNIVEGMDNKSVLLKIRDLKNETEKATRFALYSIGKALNDEAKRLINLKPKHGKTYLVKLGDGGKSLKRLKKHVASAPGEAPAKITGTLEKALNFNVHANHEVQVGVDLTYGNAFYGKYLEFENLINMSGQGSRNIAPRPYLSGAYNNKKRDIINLFDKALENTIK